MAERLARLDIHSPEDLLFHLPHRYQNRTRTCALGRLEPEVETGCQGVIRAADRTGQRRSMFVVRIEDGTGFLTLRFFQVWPSLTRALRPGRSVWAFGTVRAGRSGLEMVHPEFRSADGEPPEPPGHLTPVYPLTEGLTQGRMRTWVGHAMDRFAPDLPDSLPAWIRDAHRWPTVTEALEQIHRPPPETDPEALAHFRIPAQRRLAFEELLGHHLALREARTARAERGAPPLQGSRGLPEALLTQLPFSLTGAQQRAWRAIRRDLSGERPMQRLLQGDVGSGKTVVAVLAGLQAVDAGYQVAFMAPTEVLAEQHAETLRGWLDPLGVEVRFLGGGLGDRERRAEASAIAEGRTQVAVGTHALFQEDVRFGRLGLAVIDEQHRFGVHQRLALKE